MTNFEYDDKEYVLFDRSKAFENYAEDEDFMTEQLKAGIKAFDKGGEIDQITNMYLKFDWHIVGSKEWYSFKMKAHSLKGRFRYMGADYIEKRFERLQSSIQNAYFVQIQMRMEEMLEACRPTHIAIMEFLKIPIQDPFTFDHRKISNTFCHPEKGKLLRMNLSFRPNQINPNESKILHKYLVVGQDPALGKIENEEQKEKPQLYCVIF